MPSRLRISGAEIGESRQWKVSGEMHCLIITGGYINDSFAENYIKSHKFDRVLCADKGMRFCKEIGLVPDLIIGDFDSVDAGSFAYFQEHCPERMERFPVKKDAGDTELAIVRAISDGAEAITILGATGGRLDHLLGNIELLKLARDHGVECLIVDSRNRVRLIDRNFSMKKEEQFGKYVSLIPYTPTVEGLTLRGFAYELTDFTLTGGNTLGVSNQITADVGEITFREGLLLVIEARD